MKDELRESATNIKTSEVERTWQAYLTLPYRSKSEYKALVHGYAAGCEAGKPKWIPVSERLPEVIGEYLVRFRQDQTGNLETTIGGLWDDGGLFWQLDGTGDDDVNEVVAWMPIPSYTEGE